MRVWDAPAGEVPAGYRDVLVCGTEVEIRNQVDRYAAAGRLVGMTVPRPYEGQWAARLRLRDSVTHPVTRDVTRDRVRDRPAPVALPAAESRASRLLTRFPVEATLLVVSALGSVGVLGWLLAGVAADAAEAVVSYRQHIIAVLLLAGVAAGWWGSRRLRRRFGRSGVGLPHHCPGCPHHH